MLLLLCLLIASGDALGYRVTHKRNRCPQTDEHSLTNNNMADVQFANLRKSGKMRRRLEIEAVARMNLDAGLRRKLGGS